MEKVKLVLWCCALLIPYTGFFLYKLIRKRTKSLISVLVTVAFLIGLSYTPFAFFNCGNTEIGSIFEKNHYTEEFYVYLTENRKSEKRYKVKATIVKQNASITEDRYFIKKVYWENGGSHNFSTGGVVGERIYPYVETDCEDENGDIYCILLTNEKTK